MKSKVIQSAAGLWGSVSVGQTITPNDLPWEVWNDLLNAGFIELLPLPQGNSYAPDLAQYNKAEKQPIYLADLLPNTTVALLAGEGIETVDDLQSWIAEHNDLTKIKGVGQVRAQEILGVLP